MSRETDSSWERLLDPKQLRTNLIFAAIYIAVFELTKDTIVDRIWSFYSLAFDEHGPVPDSEYDQKVLTRNKSPLYASLDWLRESSAIDDADLTRFETIKECRNRLAHEMTDFVFAGVTRDDVQNFQAMASLLHKIEVWWILNVDAPTNPAYDGADLDERDITPGSMIWLRVMLDVALGEEADAAQYYRAFVERSQQPSDKE